MVIKEKYLYDTRDINRGPLTADAIDSVVNSKDENNPKRAIYQNLKNMIKVRNENQVFAQGKLSEVSSNKDNVFSYKVEDGNDSVLVLNNLTDGSAADLAVRPNEKDENGSPILVDDPVGKYQDNEKIADLNNGNVSKFVEKSIRGLGEQLNEEVDSHKADFKAGKWDSFKTALREKISNWGKKLADNVNKKTKTSINISKQEADIIEKQGGLTNMLTGEKVDCEVEYKLKFNNLKPFERIWTKLNSGTQKTEAK